MPPTLDSPPPMPASAKAQMGAGANPFQGMGELVKGAGSPAGGPVGDLKLAFDTVKKVLQEKIAGMSAGKELVSRAMQLLDQALEMESQKGPGTPPTKSPDMGSPAEVSGGSRPPMQSFPG